MTAYGILQRIEDRMRDIGFMLDNSPEEISPNEKLQLETERARLRKMWDGFFSDEPTD